jgi:type II secretory pathway pseudopilin PulG
MNRTTNRTGFTITELLVSLALIVFIMSILATAFSAASKSVSDLKAANELAEKLRGVMTLLRRDLHDTGTRLSSEDWPPPVDGDDGNERNRRGFFRLLQNGLPQTALPEPFSFDDATIFAGSALHFSTFLRGTDPASTFSTQLVKGHPLFGAGSPAQIEGRFQSLAAGDPAHPEIPPVYRSRAAEVVWYLVPSGEQTPPHTDPSIPVGVTNQQPLYVLVRRQRLLEENENVQVPPGNPALSWPTVIPPPPAEPMNTIRTIRVPALRYGSQIPAADLPPNGAPSEDPSQPVYAGLPLVPAQPYPFNPNDLANDVPDIVMNDVLSFDVTVLPHNGTRFVHLSDLQAFNGGNPAYPPGGPLFVFDTWTSQTFGRLNYGTDGPGPPRWQRPGSYASIPLYRNAAGELLRIKAIRVTLRIWDSKSQFTRQVSMIQDM